MLDVIKDTLLDLVKLLPFLFIAFLIIELIEHKFSNKTKNIISKSNRFGPVIGSVLGAVPQCSFSVLATNLYVTRIISLGTLISIYLSTSDEMLPVLISHQTDIKVIVLIISLKVIIGMLCGFIIDLLIRKKKSSFHICEDEHCDCDESLIKSVLIHTVKTALFILIITFILNLLFAYYEDFFENFFVTNTYLSPFISSLIGLIPNCGSSVMITELYINNVLTLGTTISGLLTNSGVALIVLFKSNKDLKENLLILTILYLCGSIIGLLINVLH